MLVPYFLYIRVLSINFCFTKKNLITVKRIPKKVFSQKKLFTERKFVKCCEAKKDAQGQYKWAQQKFQSEKSNLKVWHSYRKNSLNHTSETKKSVFFLMSYFEKCFYMHGLYLLQTLVYIV